jgi:hypothetical protein
MFIYLLKKQTPNRTNTILVEVGLSTCKIHLLQSFKKVSTKHRVMTRTAVSAQLKEELLIESGYKCSVPRCEITESLEFHHINGDAADNRKDNLIVFCAVHHHQATIKKISAKACLIIKKTLPNLDGLNLNLTNELALSEQEFVELLSIAREIPKESLRIISEQFIASLQGKNMGYYCRPGIEENDYLARTKLICEGVHKDGFPTAWRISEFGKTFCKFLYSSQYFLPFAAFDNARSKEWVVELNFRKIPTSFSFYM